MQVNSVINSQIVPNKQNFKGSSATFSPFLSFPSYQPIPLETSKAYASPQITEGYKEIETFDIPYIGKGKLYELTNGHKVIIVPKASKTYISTIVVAGASDEPADKKDIAHLTEHLLANYWHNTSSNSDITKALKEVGADLNAITRKCPTTYHMSANIQDNKDLENLIKIQLATLTNKNNFTEDKIEKEKEIIKEEAKEQEYFINEDREARTQSIKNIFNLDNTNGIVAGYSMQKIDDIKKEDLEKFYNNFYRPDNMITILVGNVDNESIAIVSKYLNTMTNPKTAMKRENAADFQYDNLIKQSKRTVLTPYNWSKAKVSFC